MSFRALFTRRPSPSMVVAGLALFLSLGGVGYAATQLPAGSVGSSQLRNNSVTQNKIDFLSVGFRKIQPGAVGIRRINTGQVQVRVTGVCSAGSAIASIDSQGAAQCTATAPKEFGATGLATTVNAASTPIKALSLPAGASYMVFANPQVTVSGAQGSQVQVDCTLSVFPGDSSTTQTRSLTFQVGTQSNLAGSIPLMIPAPAVANGSSAAVSCTRSATSGTPTASVLTSINAIQTASNN